MNMVSDDPVLAAHDARSQEAVQVIREMGTNAVPPLLHWIAYEPPVSRYHLAPVCRRLPRWVLARLPPHWFLGNYERERSANKAARVFALLGPEAAPAIPELMRLARIPAGRRYLVEETPGRAMAALAMLGPPAIPFFQSQLSSAKTPAFPVWDAIHLLGTNARPLVPLLIQSLQHTNSLVTQSSAQILSDLKLEPELVLPALTNSLYDQRAATRYNAVSALQKLGPLAQLALPALTNCLKDPDPDVRAIAAEAIQSIPRNR